MDFFPSASPYRNCRTDHEDKFDHIITKFSGNDMSAYTGDPFLIQVVHFPNFSSEKSFEIWKCSNDGTLSKVDAIGDEWRKGNSYKNYKTRAGCGHAKGIFYELNLYLHSQNRSNHHTSTLGGATFTRDTSHDGASIETKGPHW